MCSQGRKWKSQSPETKAQPNSFETENWRNMLSLFRKLQMACFYKSWVHEGSICIRLLLTFKAGLDVSRKRSTMNGKIGKRWKKLSIVLELLTTISTCTCSLYNLTNFFSRKASFISRNVLPCQIGWILPREAVTGSNKEKILMNWQFQGVHSGLLYPSLQKSRKWENYRVYF